MVSVMERKLRYSSMKMMSSVTGTTIFRRAVARSRYSYWPLQTT
ncbi:Uncharacterised protein [Mycobacterium tuberculosis]|nr:Uncharacterised protein [Mycobacterium tuberculosis]